MNSKYPKLDDKLFQKKISTIYRKYRLVKNETFKSICFPKKFSYQIPQLFVSQFINPNTPYRGLLICHKIGAGKTCASILIGEEWKHKYKIIYCCPASLIGNVYKELRSECTKNNYVSKEEREILNKYLPGSSEYEDILDKVNKRIDKYYDIMSYNKFYDLSIRRKIDLSNKIVIIDEVQNIISEKGTFYEQFMKEIRKGPRNLRVILLSATPIFDKPSELALTINLLRPNIDLPIGNNFNNLFLEDHYDKKKKLITYDIKNRDKLLDLLRGYISYYTGAPDFVFPRKIVHIVKCKMSTFQYKLYKIVETKEGKLSNTDILKLPNNFFIGSRLVSNVVFPNRKINDKGFNSFTRRALKEDLKKYSIKFYKILKKIKACKGTIFIYSNFLQYGGIKSLVKVLEYNGYKNFYDHGIGKNRYAIWSGNETLKSKETAKDIFNRYDNKDGSKIKIIIGSPAIKEGVSLLRVKQAHILEPYWNESRLKQIIGRVARFCSHKDVIRKDRYVDIYIYIAVAPISNKLTVDQHILDIARNKGELIDKFEDVIKESSVDYYLNL
jgi:superfamily II DNA or RNA helicase